MGLKNEKVEVFQMFGEGSLNDLSRALENFLNDGWVLEYSNLAPTTPQADRFRGVYILTRKVERVTQLTSDSEPVSDSVVEVVKSGRVGKKVSE